MAAFKLTIRNGSKVSREDHDSLPGAIASMRGHAERIRAEGDLPEVSMIRTYAPGDRVRARIEISTGRFLRSRDAGVDVMGDGEVVAFRGGVGRHPLKPESGQTPYDAVEAALR